jgi:hypothetical protein
MNIKILYHLMPWEIDYCLLSFSQLKKSKYFLNNDVNITINSVLNLSSYSVDWENSKISKEFFIQKYEMLSNLLVDYNHEKKIYEGDKLYGHLNLQKESIDNQTDFYLMICPDMYFSSKILGFLCEAIKIINNKYFLVTPQISKFWDSSWDVITHPKFMNNLEHKNWWQTDVYDIINYNETTDREIFLTKTPTKKWAGWFDLYNKAFVEELCYVFDDWNGYGGWDYFSMLLTNHLENKIDFQQYVLNNEVVFEYSVGPLWGINRDGFASYYKSNLKIKDNLNNQREDFDRKIPYYLDLRIKDLKNKNII